VQQVAVVAAPVAPALAQEFPEVEAAIRLRRHAQLVSYGEKKFFGEQIIYADSNFFSFFEFALLQGHPENVLAAPGSLVLTEKMAKKYFGDEDPIGKVLKIDNRYDGTVTGVMQNIPRNSHFHGDAISAFSAFKDEPWINNWGVNLLWAYVRLNESASSQSLNAKLPAFIEKYRGKDTLANISYYLQPLTAIHLRSHFIAEIAPNSDIAYVYIFSSIAAFVLLIACINYMNLATARSAKRMKEVGMRKVLGADRLQIIKQFLASRAYLRVMVLCAFFGRTLLPAFRDLSGKALSINYLADPVLRHCCFSHSRWHPAERIPHSISPPFNRPRF
jgi:putative ABC transport system permease protein